MLSEEALKECDLHTLGTLLAFQANNRGDESWGVVKVTPGTPAAYEVLKDIGSIRKTCRVNKILAPTVVGHTRKATTGKITQENAHPFVHGKIIGAHNGFIYDHDGLNKSLSREFNVDSQHLIAHIAEGKPIEELGGSGTVSYINTDAPEVVYLGRGIGSDLVVYGIGAVKKPIGIVWASIGHWLKDALDMAGLKDNFTYNTDISKLYRIEKYDLYIEGEFKLGPSRARFNQIDNNDSGYGYSHGCHSWPTGYGYRGRTQFDEKEYDKEKRFMIDTPKRELTELSKSELDRLPDSLKKKIKKSVEWRKGKQKKLLRQLGDVMHATISEKWLGLMRKMLGE